MTEKKSIKINNKMILSSHKYLKNRSIDELKYIQNLATQKVFKKKNIPFRTFEIYNRNE